MAQTTSTGDKVNVTSVAMTPLNLYLQRVGSISNKLRAESSGYDFYPFQLGGIEGQRQVLDENVVISVVDFKVSGNT